MSAASGYNRRSFGNFFVVDNQLVGPDDYEPWTYLAPQHPGLPGGGGYPITVYSITRAAALRGACNYQTFDEPWMTALRGLAAYTVAEGGGWLQPTSIVSPRFARFNVTLTF